MTFRHWYSMTFWGGDWRGDHIFKIQIFIYSNEEDVARFSLFCFSKIGNMFLSKVQQFYCYIQLCNYREEFVFNILLGCNLSRPSTLISVFLMGRSGYPSKWANWWRRGGGLLQAQKLEFSPSVGYHPHQKIVFPCPSPDQRPHIGKKGISNNV